MKDKSWPAGALAAVAALVLGAGLAGCVPAPDLAPVQAERSKPVQRFDAFQSAASNGKWIAAGAAGGVVVVSGDAGATWVRHTLAQPSSVVAMTHCPDGSFAALDFYKKVWTAGADAATWTAQPIPTRSDLLSITCDPANRLWVVGAQTSILSSADKGASWKTQDLGEDAILTTAQFTDANHAVITGEFGTVLTSADAGASWQPQPLIPNEFYPYAAWFADAQTGWVSGLAGVILHTADGGKTWTPQTNPTAAPMYALVPLGAELYGLGAGGRMVMLRDQQWVAFEHGKSIPAHLAAGAALDERSMLVAGAGGALSVINLPARAALAAAR